MSTELLMIFFPTHFLAVFLFVFSFYFFLSRNSESYIFSIFDNCYEKTYTHHLINICKQMFLFLLFPNVFLIKFFLLYLARNIYQFDFDYNLNIVCVCDDHLSTKKKNCLHKCLLVLIVLLSIL